MSKVAGPIFQPLGLIYGMMVGMIAANRIYGAWDFAWWMSESYRLAYIFTTAFLSISAVICWVSLHVKKRNK